MLSKLVAKWRDEAAKADASEPPESHHDYAANRERSYLCNKHADELEAMSAPVEAVVVGYANRNEFELEGCGGFMCSKRPPLTEASFFTIPLYTIPPAVREVVPDPILCRFYQVETVEELLAAQEEHILKLQETVRHNVKPWEDTTC